MDALKVLRDKAGRLHALANKMEAVADELQETFVSEGKAHAIPIQMTPKAVARSRSETQSSNRFPYGKPMSQGGELTNTDVVTNFMKKRKKATLAEAHNATGLPKGSVSSVFSLNKRFRNHDGYWLMK